MNRKMFGAAFSMLSLIWVAALPAAAQVQVSQAVHFDVSPPLSELAQQVQSAAPQLASATHTVPRNRLPMPQFQLQADSALQLRADIKQRATVLGGFQGIGVGLGSFQPTFTPPDTTGAVGATQYVQWVNVDLAVFDKASGAPVMGPVPGNTLWAGFGGACETANDGDPIVEYDKAAGRWVLSQFTAEAPYMECVAVSTTSDATGSYNRYAFAMGPNFADYPHLGVWPDGYYFSFNMFTPQGSGIGGRACAFDRTAMLAGQPAMQECFDSATIFGMVPSDWDGAVPPPAGAPNNFVQFGSRRGISVLNLYALHADFVTPANATFSAPQQIAVASFIPACLETEPQPIGDGGGTDPDQGSGCIPQRATKQALDELSDRMMYRAAYRNFGDHESLVATHTVARVVKGTNRIRINGASIRWYELRAVSTASPTVFQQGTFGPNQQWRWMPSIGMDSAGDIAVGYSTSGPGMFPGIRFTGRTASDPSGVMEAERVIVRGTGSQTGTYRWGDYSALSIDPADDCTFWYTTEYLKKSAASAGWSTWIASFKFPDCQ